MPLYIGEYLADTAHLTIEQSGAYLHLLMSHWRVGYVPDDDAKLAVLCRVSKGKWERSIGPALRPFFDAKDGRLTQKRMVAELEKAAKTSSRRAQNALTRWNKTDPQNPIDNNDVADAKASDLHTFCISHARTLQLQLQEEEKKEPPLTPPPQEVTASAEPPPDRRKRGTRLAPDWVPNATDCQFARSLGLNPCTVGDSFRDFWIAKTGAQAAKLDWSATWRNWCRREAERKPRDKPKYQNGFIGMLAEDREALPRDEENMFLRFPNVH